MREKIEKRIRESGRRLGPAEIRAELMKRNPRFRREWKAAVKFVQSDTEWKTFCDRWRISEDWDGPLEKLSECVYSLPSLHYSIPRARLSKKKIELKSLSYYPDAGPWRSIGEPLQDSIQNEDGYIYVRIHPWTIKKDLAGDRLWRELQVAQKKVFGDIFQGRERRTFERDLCWYDLHKGKEFGRLSVGKIAMAWKLQQNQRISINTINSAIRQMGKLINEFSC